MTAQSLNLSRRDFLTGLGLTASAVALSACVPVSPAAAPAAGNAPSAAATELQIWINWGGVWQEALQAIADAFVEANPQYTVEMLPGQSGSEGMTKFLASIAGNNAPHLYTTPAASGNMLLTREVLRPLTPYLANSAIKPEDFIEAQLGFYTKEETLYGVPTIEGAAGQAIIWNKAHFAEAGLDPEVGPQSFDELVSFSEQLTQFDDAGNLVRLGFDPRDARGADLVGWWFELDWFDEEARQLKLNTENLVWGVEWVVDFARRVGPEKMNAFRQEYVAWTNDPKSGFVSGAQSMLMSAYYVPGELARLAPDLEAGYTWVPTLYNQKVSVIYGWFWVMANNSPDPDNAWQFVEHASTVDSVNTIFNVAGGFPTYKPFIDQADFSQYKGLQWFVDSAYNADAFYVYPALPIAGSEISDRLRAGMDEMTFDQIEAQPMLDRVQEETQKLLDQAFAAS